MDAQQFRELNLFHGDVIQVSRDGVHYLGRYETHLNPDEVVRLNSGRSIVYFEISEIDMIVKYSPKTRVATKVDNHVKRKGRCTC